MPKHVGIGSAVLGLCLAVGSGSCGEHVVVVDLVNLAAEATTVSAYYRIDDDSYRASTVPSGQLPSGSPAIGIRPPASRDGTLNVHVLAYKSNVPCAINKGSTDVGVGASGKISATTVLDPVAYSPCSANDAPIRYPVDAKVWAGAPNNVWIVGKDAAVLRWDGAVFREVNLPAAVLGAGKPTWRAVHGDSQGNVWISGDNESVVRISASGDATRIPIQIAMKPTDPLSFWGVYAESGAAWIVGTRINSTADLVGGYLGKYDSATNKFVLTETDGIAGVIDSNPLFDVDCSSNTDCWFVGRDLIIHYANNIYKQEYIYTDVMTCSSQSGMEVRSVYANSTLSLIKMVGEAGHFVFHNGKCFNTATQDSMGTTIDSDLISISARGPKDIFFVGRNALYRWRNAVPDPIFAQELGPWQSVAVVPGGFFALSQTGRIFYADVAP